MPSIGMTEGFDVGLEMSGSADALREMLQNMCHGGKIAMLGIPGEQATTCYLIQGESLTTVKVAVEAAGGEITHELGVIRALAAELTGWGDRPALRRARLLLEPGRWLAGPAGAYLCRVVRTKERGGRVVAISDGGIHHLLRPRLVGSDHRVVPVGAAAGRPELSRVDITGPLCTGLDILATDVSLPEPRPGDLYAVLDAGAYGYSESMPLFLTHPIPAEIVVSDGSITISRERIEPD